MTREQEAVLKMTARLAVAMAAYMLESKLGLASPEWTEERLAEGLRDLHAALKEAYL